MALPGPLQSHTDNSIWRHARAANSCVSACQNLLKGKLWTRTSSYIIVGLSRAGLHGTFHWKRMRQCHQAINEDRETLSLYCVITSDVSANPASAQHRPSKTFAPQASTPCNTHRLEEIETSKACYSIIECLSVHQRSTVCTRADVSGLCRPGRGAGVRGT